MAKDNLLLGNGFPWDLRHTQTMRTLATHNKKDFAIESLDGDPLLHGIGRVEETPVTIPVSELNKHTAICGTTGSGKTTLYALLIYQCILRGDPIIIIDPKGESPSGQKGLLDQIWSACVATGREKDFLPFFLPSPSISSTYSPTYNFVTGTDIADRIAGVLGGDSGDSEVFRNFCRGLISSVVEGLLLLGLPVNTLNLEKYCIQRIDDLIKMVLTHWHEIELLPIWRQPGDNEPTKSSPKDSISLLIESYKHYTASGGQKGCRAANGLIAIAEQPKDFFKKTHASLEPLLTDINSGARSRLFSPDRPPDIIWKNVVARKQIVYFNLGSMIFGETAYKIAKMITLDLMNFIGQRQNYSDDRSLLWLFVDEFSNVATPQFTDLLSKARSAGLGVFLAMQSVADLVVRMGAGGKAHAQQILDNTNVKIWLRSDNDSAEFFTRRLAEVRLPEESTSYSLRPEGDKEKFFATTKTISARTADVELLQASWIANLLPGEAYASFLGKVWKVRIPMLPPPHSHYAPLPSW